MNASRPQTIVDHDAHLLALMTAEGPLNCADAGCEGAAVGDASTALTNFDAAYRALALASTVDDAREIGNAAAAFLVYARRAGLGLEMQNKAAELKMRAERRCGELLPETIQRGGDATLRDVRLVDLGVSEVQSHRWQRVAAIPLPTFERYLEVTRGAGEEITTAGLLAHRDFRAGYSSESFEWCTPGIYIEAACRVMGGLDLDPASCALANEVVRATAYFDKEQDGLRHDWPGRVWLNPPYCHLQSDFVAHLLGQYEAGITEQAVLLLSMNSSETGWFQPLWDQILCFTCGRVNFYNATGDGRGCPHGSVFVYLGPREKWPVFAAEFSPFGPVVARWSP